MAKYQLTSVVDTLPRKIDDPPATADDALLFLADGSKLSLSQPPQRQAGGDWALGPDASRPAVRDADVWFSEAALQMPAGDVRPPQPLPVTVQLPDRARLEGRLIGIRLEDGMTWLRWERDGRQREVRLLDAALERVAIELRAPGMLRKSGVPVAVPPPAPAAAQPCPSPVFARLADGTHLAQDTDPRRLSDGSWHLSVDGHTRIVGADDLLVVETGNAAAVPLIPAGAPLKVALIMPGGERVEGDLLASQVEADAVWLRWRRDGRELTLRVAAAVVAGFECTMRSPQRVGAIGTGPVRDAARVPLLRSAADLDAYVSSYRQGEIRQLEPHFHIDEPAWCELAGDRTAARDLFRMAQRLGLALVDLHAVDATPAAVAALPPDLAHRFRMVPLRVGQTLIVAATDNTSDGEAQGTIEFSTGRHLLQLLALPAEVRGAIARHYDRIEDNALMKSLMLGSDSDDDSDRSTRENERLAREQPIVRLVTSLIDDAVKRRASDIHVRPREEDFEVLFRIDGALLPVRTFAKPLLRAVISRIKVIAGMDITERRLPQDGRVTVNSGGADIDLRISVLPSVNGESVVMRLLNTRDGLRSLAEIGFTPQDEQIFRDLLARSHGMILVTGPTGCGKSTTLYAALREARKRDVNIITVEDPVEYHIADVTQIQVNQGIGFDFARVLRNILRHDPDIVMVGEIRDHQTAEIAVESALTGHVVLSTLHTNSAATTVTRLLDLGVEAFLLRSTLLAVLAQRLARRNCRQCTAPERVDPHVRKALGVDDGDVFYRGVGCPHCNGTGVHGRIAVYELMPVTPELRKLIVANVDGDLLHTRAVDAGMVPITNHALALARAGIISLAEVYRIRVE